MIAPSLYVHVPFCKSRCGYCTFVSYTSDDAELQRRVIGRTLDQARWWADHLGGLSPRTVYVGGGTPSILEPAVFRTLLEGLAALFVKPPAEMTVEANPDSLGPEFLECCLRAGANRVSVGIQTFSPEIRRAAGRRCPQPDIQRCRELLGAWRGQVSLDLIAGFSGQAPGDVVRDVDRAVEWRPDHVSLYSLTLEGEHRSLRLSQRADDLWLEGFDRLEERGYQNYEVCNFAPRGRECQHNLVYWHLDPYVGVGPSAVSTVPGIGGAVLRIQSPPDLDVFLEGDTPAPLDGAERLAPEDLLFETLIMGLRLRDGLDKAALGRRLGQSIESVLPRTLERWRQRGLLSDDPGRLGLTREGRLILDGLLVEAREEIDALAPGRLSFHWP